MAVDVDFGEGHDAIEIEIDAACRRRRRRSVNDLAIPTDALPGQLGGVAILIGIKRAGNRPIVRQAGPFARPSRRIRGFRASGSPLLNFQSRLNASVLRGGEAVSEFAAATREVAPSSNIEMAATSAKNWSADA